MTKPQGDARAVRRHPKLGPARVVPGASVRASRMWEPKWGGCQAHCSESGRTQLGWGCWVTWEEKARAGLPERDGLVFLPLESVL